MGYVVLGRSPAGQVSDEDHGRLHERFHVGGLPNQRPVRGVDGGGHNRAPALERRGARGTGQVVRSNLCPFPNVGNQAEDDDDDRDARRYGHNHRHGLGHAVLVAEVATVVLVVAGELSPNAELVSALVLTLVAAVEVQACGRFCCLLSQC